MRDAGLPVRRRRRPHRLFRTWLTPISPPTPTKVVVCSAPEQPRARETGNGGQRLDGPRPVDGTVTPGTAGSAPVFKRRKRTRRFPQHDRGSRRSLFQGQERGAASMSLPGQPADVPAGGHRREEYLTIPAGRKTARSSHSPFDLGYHGRECPARTTDTGRADQTLRATGAGWPP